MTAGLGRGMGIGTTPTRPWLPVTRAVPRTRLSPVPVRPVPEWTRTHWRVGHLPGSPAMATEFVKAGYNVVTLNVLGKWDIVGPSAKLYPAERVKEAEAYMREHVEKCHKAGAKASSTSGRCKCPWATRRS